MAEARSGEADQILAAAEEIWVSDLVVAEFYVSLARKLKLGALSPEDDRLIRELFAQQLGDELLRRATIQPKHSEMAGRVALESPVVLRTLDALHLTIAIELDLVMATFDVRLAEAARALEVPVQDGPISAG